MQESSVNHARKAYRQIVLTGGPGAGKTAVLELARKAFCRHVLVAPEAASIVFGGGFPRDHDIPARKASQHAIYSVQVQLENYARTRNEVRVVLCDRGTVDGLAYWPGSASDYWTELGTNLVLELERYAAVIHLHPPLAAHGYDLSNHVRIETAEEAAIIDARITEAWRDHPHRFDVPATDDFVAKAARTIEIIRSLIPACCSAAQT